MKFLCHIAIIIVLMLSIKPCCADDCASKFPSNTTSSATSQQKEKECRGCSPFFSCGTCAGFVVAKTINYLLITEPEIIKHYNTYQQPYIEEITSSIWQPPQLG